MYEYRSNDKTLILNSTDDIFSFLGKSSQVPCQEEKYWSGQKSMPNISKKQLKNVAAGKTEWHYPKKNTKKKLKQRQLYC